jgi:hypothetical protein
MAFLCICALLGACGQSPQDDTARGAQASANSNPDSNANNATTQSLQPNELQDWARQATSDDAPEAPATDHAAVAKDASDALATPVIHTVD